MVFDTYDLARGFTLEALLRLCSDSESELTERVTFFFFGVAPSGFSEVVLVFLMRGYDSGPSGHSVRRTSAMGPILGLLALLLALLLRRLVGRQDQHLRQLGSRWVFGQQSRTLDPLRLLGPAL